MPAVLNFLDAGALVPVRLRNLLAAGKNIGTTHVSNGCFRLHPVEWNIGESAGAAAAFCVRNRTEPHAVHADERLRTDLQATLTGLGVPLDWPASVHADASAKTSAAKS